MVNAGMERQRWHFPRGRRGVSDPVVADGVVYVSSASEVYAVEAATGQQRWKFSTGHAWNEPTAPGVYGGMVYFGSENADGHLYALDVLTGQQLWRVSTGGPVTSCPVVVDGVVYVGNPRGLCALDATTGEWRWELFSSTVFGCPAVADGVMYVHAGGQGDGCGLYAVDPATGEQWWKFSTGHEWKESSAPAVAGGIVYVGSGSSLYAVDAHDGQQRWGFLTGHYVTSSPTVVDGRVYVGSWDNHLYAVDADTGELNWKFSTAGAVASSAVVVDGLVYVGSWDHSLYVVDAATGELHWKFATSDWVGSPAVVDGLAYIGTRDGHLYALDTAPSPPQDAPVDEARQPKRSVRRLLGRFRSP